MSEFNNRIAAQRRILQIVNRNCHQDEELFSLSAKAIERWCLVNQLDPESKVPKLLTAASARLFFLANKSQEQISPEYIEKSKQIDEIATELDQCVD